MLWPPPTPPHRFSQAEYDEASSRLQQLERLLKQHAAASVDDLLGLAAVKVGCCLWAGRLGWMSFWAGCCQGWGHLFCSLKGGKSSTFLTPSALHTSFLPSFLPYFPPFFVQEAALDEYFQLEGRREELESQAAALEQAVREQALALSTARRSAAGRMRHAMEGVLASLAMGGARFDVRLRWTPAEEGSGSGSGGRTGGAGAGTASSGRASRDSSGISVGPEEASACWETPGRYRVRPAGGLDQAEYMFAAGPAEPLRPLAAVASGGESARIMLALKCMPALAVSAASAAGSAAPPADPAAAAGVGGQAATADPGSCSAALGSPLLVLDEIDSGVGSRLGQPVGRVLRQIAGSAVGQVLCVSHLPQVGS